jgi:hypothetical protein
VWEERDAMFAELDVEADEEEAQDVSSSTSAALPVRFQPSHNDHVAGPSTSCVIHMTDSGDEE